MRGRLKLAPVPPRHPHAKHGARELPISDATYFKHININTDYPWWECTVDWCKEVAGHLGLDIDDIQWDEHTCGLKGRYRYNPNATMFVRAEFPNTPYFHRIIDVLDTAATVRDENGSVVDHLCASLTIAYYGGSAVGTYVDAEPDDWETLPDDAQWDDDSLVGAIRDFARWCHGQIMDEYEYITSKEAVADALRNTI